MLLCAAYLLPGQFGREPWKNADITAFGYMSSIAEGRSPWTAPALAGLPGDGALLPYWLGALSIKALPFIDAANAARVPFALLLAATLALIWHTTQYLARTEAAPASIDDAAIQTWLSGKLNADDLAFPAHTANTVYVLFCPSGTTVTVAGSTSCQSFGVYHQNFALDDAHGASSVACAVVPRWAASGTTPSSLRLGR